MQIKTFVGTAILYAGCSLAAPMNNVRESVGGFPLFTPTGNGQGHGQLILGGGIFPTLTFGGGLGGQDNQLAFGASNTLGIGGGPLPTALAGFGAGAGIDPNDILLQASATASEGGWLNGLVPTLQGGVNLNGNVGYKSSSGRTAVAGANGGAFGTLGYGGIFLPSSTLGVSAGANFGINIHNGAVTPTSTSTSSTTT